MSKVTIHLNVSTEKINIYGVHLIKEDNMFFIFYQSEIDRIYVNKNNISFMNIEESEESEEK